MVGNLFSPSESRTCLHKTLKIQIEFAILSKENSSKVKLLRMDTKRKPAKIKDRETPVVNCV